MATCGVVVVVVVITNKTNNDGLACDTMVNPSVLQSKDHKFDSQQLALLHNNLGQTVSSA